MVSEVKNLDYVNATLVNLIRRNLNAMGGATEYFESVYNLEQVRLIWLM